jgi:hypothetical protein
MSQHSQRFCRADEKLRPTQSDHLAGTPHATTDARQVISNRDMGRILKSAPVQRAGSGPTSLDEHVARAIEARIGRGAPLPGGLREEMETAFNDDLSRVRVHTDSEAHTLNETMHARAFTTGSDIFFTQGVYDPSSTSGRQLLGHELTHVVQQRSGTSGLRPGQVSRPSDPAEQQAEAVGQSIAGLSVARTLDAAPAQRDLCNPFVLQRAAGNKASARLIAQRAPGSAAEIIESRDYKAALDVIVNSDSLHRYPSADQFALLGLVLKNRSEIDEMFKIYLTLFWNDQLDGVSEEADIVEFFSDPDRFDAWKRSVEVDSSLIRKVEPIAGSFKADVLGVATHRLDLNRRFAEDELRTFTETNDGTPGFNKDRLAELQSVARSVVGLKEAQSLLLDIPVAMVSDPDPDQPPWVYEGAAFGEGVDDTESVPVRPITFSPDEDPAACYSVVQTLAPHTIVQLHWDLVAGVLNKLVSDYPVLSAMLKRQNIEELAGETDGSFWAGETVTSTLFSVLADISTLRHRLGTGKLV